ncbi:Oxidase ustYa [Colletotrichum higginsianum]|uniref:Oxidase ustYa n=1 Tax=Colletotrichum higginsianum TaxID=80884 RepID=A0A4T0VNV6_9PEZI|nr:Oxidase ustYa [Colletotrichum higginsianum]
MVTFNSNFAEDQNDRVLRRIYRSQPCLEKVDGPLYGQITGEEAERISRPTSKISNDPDYYITNPDVYHHLHCLNDIRKFVAQHNSSEHQLDRLQTMHKFHCIDSIRQSLMCSADVSLVHWYWAPSPGKHFQNATTTHICRKWSKIKKWAVSHRLDEERFDRHKFVE